jgi:hypothetical protein
MVESMVLAATDGAEVKNFSETYLTYWHFRNELLYRVGIRSSQVQTGGNFATARNLIQKHGLLNEGDFIESEKETISSTTQLTAQNEINKSLKSGALSALLTGEEMSEEEKIKLVDAELQRVFQVDIQEKVKRSISGDDLLVKSSITGEPIPLNEELNNWETINFRKMVLKGWMFTFPENIPVEELDYSKTISLTSRQKDLFQVLKAALNDKLPVLLSWSVENNARKDGVYNIDNLIAKGKPGEQGLHLTIIEDYTASGFDPMTGERFSLGEGELTPEEKKLALDYGKIDDLIIKNSWGLYPGYTYKADGEYGYHKLNKSYLLTWLKANGVEDTILPLKSLVLPSSYIKKYSDKDLDKM